LLHKFGPFINTGLAPENPCVKTKRQNVELQNPDCINYKKGEELKGIDGSER
jgi:hypothetical protein